MEEVDSHAIQHTPPPSPYLETTWDLPLEEVHNGLLHPKERKLGYLELYFAGFMEFVDEPPSPAMSDDETEYPHWESIKATRDEPPALTASSEAPQSMEMPQFNDTTESDIPPLSHRTATASTVSTSFEGYESSSTDFLLSALPERVSSTRYRRRRQESRRSNLTSQSRVQKAYRRSRSTVQTRSMAINRQSRLRRHSTSLDRKSVYSKRR